MTVSVVGASGANGQHLVVQLLAQGQNVKAIMSSASANSATNFITTERAFFDARKVSRINVGHFMANHISDANLWNTWKGQMPVIYSKDSNEL